MEPLSDNDEFELEHSENSEHSKQIQIPFARISNADIDDFIQQKLTADFQTTPPVIVEEPLEPNLTPKPSQAQINMFVFIN